MAGAPKSYCERLRISPPDLDAVAACPECSLYHVMVAALLERGRPMAFGELVARVERVALPPRLARADLRTGLRKAWGGRTPIVPDPNGRLALDLLFHDWRHLLFHIDQERRPSQPAEPPPASFTMPADDVPLSAVEVEAALRERGPDACSKLRVAAAILETAGQPLTLDAINSKWKELSRDAYRLREETVASWRRDLVVVESSGELRLNLASRELHSFRHAIRKMAEATLRTRARWAQQQRSWEESPARVEREERHREEAEEARRTKRALLHVARQDDGTVLAATVIDQGARTIRTFKALEDTAAALAEYEFIAGVDVRVVLGALGLEPERWWLAELRPVGRTHRPSDGQAVAVTLDGCIRATTASRRNLAGPEQWSRLVGARTPGALHARLEEEARTLFAFYEYGALHGGVRVRNRAHDVHLLPVSCSMAGDSHLQAMLEAAERWWSPVELVLGEPPQLDEGWKAARRAEIVEDYWPTLYIREGDDVRAISAHDIFAIRLLDDRASGSVKPWLHRGWDERTCVIKLTLEGIEPPIWRRLVVSASDTLERLHAILQAALGWTNSHLHVFEVEGERIGTPYELDDLRQIYTRSDRIVHVGDLLDRGVTRFAYEYDFGDGWRHTVEIEEVEARDHGSSVRCTAGARACPPEDCGGVGGYARLLEILFNPSHEEFAELRVWVGPRFQPERFDLREVNDRLATVGWRGYDGGLW